MRGNFGVTGFTDLSVILKFYIASKMCACPNTKRSELEISK